MDNQLPPISTKIGLEGLVRRIAAVVLAALAIALIWVASESMLRGGIGWMWPAASEAIISVLE